MAKIIIRNRNKNQVDKNGKQKPANWEYRFEVAKINGKRKHKSKSGFKTKKEAEIAGTKALAEYNNTGFSFEPSKMSYADYLDYWFENYVMTSCKYHTQLAYRQIIEQHLKPALGMYQLQSLTPMTIQEYVNKKFVTGLKKTTLTNITSVLTGSLKYAVMPAQLLQTSPAEYIKYPKMKSERNSINRIVISVDDFHSMLERFPKGNPFRYALLIGFYTGLRISEVFALTWDDIDFQEKTLNVNKLVYKRIYSLNENDIKTLSQKINTNQNQYNVNAKNNISAKEKQNSKQHIKSKNQTLENTTTIETSAWYFGDTKTSSSVRKIKIGDTLLSELNEYRKMQLINQMHLGEHYIQICKQEEIDEKGDIIYRLTELESSMSDTLPLANLIMRKPNGKYSSTESFKYASRVIHYELGLQFNFHSLRHTHATKLIENGVSPKAVQSRLGHENIKTTLQTYVHSTDNMEQYAVDIFEKIATQKAN